MTAAFDNQYLPPATTEADWTQDFIFDGEDWTGSDVSLFLSRNGLPSFGLELTVGAGLWAPVSDLSVAVRVGRATMATVPPGLYSLSIRRLLPGGEVDQGYVGKIQVQRGPSDAVDPDDVTVQGSEDEAANTVRIFRQSGAVRIVRSGGTQGPPGPGTEEFNEAVALANEALAMRGSPPPPPDRSTLASIAGAMDAQGLTFASLAGRASPQIVVDATGQTDMTAALQRVIDELPLVPYALPRQIILDPGAYLLDSKLTARAGVELHARFRNAVFLDRGIANHDWMYGAGDEAEGTLHDLGVTGGVVFRGNRLDIDILELKIDTSVPGGKTAMARVSPADYAKLIDGQDYAITQKYRSDRSHWFFANPDDENWATSPTSNTRRTIEKIGGNWVRYGLERLAGTNYPTGTANPALSFVISDDFHCVRLPGDGDSTGLHLDIEVWDYSRGSSAVSTPGWKGLRDCRVKGGRGGSPFIHMWYALGCSEAVNIKVEGEDCDGAVVKWSGSSKGSQGFKGEAIVRRSYRGAAFPDYSDVDVVVDGEDCMRALQFTTEESRFKNNRALVHLRRCGYLASEYGAVELTGRGELVDIIGMWSDCPVIARVKTVSQASIAGEAGGTDIPMYRLLGDGSYEEPTGDGTWVTFTLPRSGGQPEYVGLYDQMPAFVSSCTDAAANGWKILTKVNAYTWKYKADGVVGRQGHTARLARMADHCYVIASDIGSTRFNLDVRLRVVGNGAPIRKPARFYEVSDDAVCWTPGSELVPRDANPADPRSWTTLIDSEGRVEGYGVDKIRTPETVVTDGPNGAGQIVMLSNTSGGKALAHSVDMTWLPITTEVNHGIGTLASAQGDLPAGTRGYVFTPGNTNSWHNDSGVYDGHHYVILDPTGAGSSTHCFVRKSGGDGYQTRIGWISGGKFQLLTRLEGAQMAWIDFGSALRRRARSYVWHVMGEGRSRLRNNASSQVTVYPNDDAPTQIFGGTIAVDVNVIVQTVGVTPDWVWNFVRTADGPGRLRFLWRGPGNVSIDLGYLDKPGDQMKAPWAATELIYRVSDFRGDWAALMARLTAAGIP